MSTFSSKQYSWSDLTIVVGGRILEGVVEVEYTSKQDKDVLRGRGSKGHNILRGNKDYAGKIVIWQSELESMTKDAPDKDILNLTFDVIVSYVPPEIGQVVVDVLKTCEFIEGKKALKQGDKQMLVELPFIFLEVKPQQ